MKDDDIPLTGYPSDAITGHHWSGKRAGRNPHDIQRRKNDSLQSNEIRMDPRNEVKGQVIHDEKKVFYRYFLLGNFPYDVVGRLRQHRLRSVCADAAARRFG